MGIGDTKKIKTGIRRVGPEEDGCLLIWMKKNCFSDKVRLEQRSKRKEGKRNMVIWGENILGSGKLKFKISRADAVSV